MSLPDLVGHSEVRTLLSRAVRSDTIAQSILLHGPRGVGKERLALWLAQLLVCEQADAEPCGQCHPCRLVRKLEHPDVHWFFPLPRPSASSADKLAEKLEDARGEEIQAWRDDPLHLPEFDKAPAHFVAAVRNLQKFASMRPVMGSRMIFIVGDADLMVPQESSPEAANAFLKLLEEPPPGTTLILTSSQPGALLPTIRSRVLSIRVGMVPEADINRLMTDAAGLDAAKAKSVARRAQGSTRRAISIARNTGGAGDSDAEAGKEFLLAALSRGGVMRLAAANDQRPAGARATLVGQLEALGVWLRDLTAVAVGATERVSDPALLPILERMAKHPGVTPVTAADALDRVDSARDLALGNVNPQLIIATLLADIQQDFAAEAGTGS